MLGEALIAAGFQRINLTILIASLPLLMLLLLVLIPAAGATGAAVALLCCYAAIVGSILFAASRTLGVTRPLRTLPLAAAAVLCGLLTLTLARELGPILSALVASVITFTLLAFTQLDALRPVWTLFIFSPIPDSFLPGIRRRFGAFRHGLG
jgi:O-antigen/teichoic acid export membrane protein